MISSWVMPVAIVGGVLGAITHELTHWLMARLCGRDAFIDWIHFDTYWLIPDEPALADRLVALAPQLTGLVALTVGLLSAPLTSSVVVAAGLIGWWIVHTLWGAPSDYAIGLGRGVPNQP